MPVCSIPYLFDLRRPSNYATFGHFAHIAPYKFIFFVYIKTQNVIIFIVALNRISTVSHFVLTFLLFFLLY